MLNLSIICMKSLRKIIKAANNVPLTTKLNPREI